MGLIRAQQILYGIMPSSEEGDAVNQKAAAQPVSQASRRSPMTEDWDLLSQIAQEVSSDMNNMAEEEENRIHLLSNQRQQLLLLAETVENTMARVIADVANIDAE